MKNRFKSLTSLNQLYNFEKVHLRKLSLAVVNFVQNFSNKAMTWSRYSRSQPQDAGSSNKEYT